MRTHLLIELLQQHAAIHGDDSPIFAIWWTPDMFSHDALGRSSCDFREGFALADWGYLDGDFYEYTLPIQAKLRDILLTTLPKPDYRSVLMNDNALPCPKHANLIQLYRHYEKLEQLHEQLNEAREVVNTLEHRVRCLKNSVEAEQLAYEAREELKQDGVYYLTIDDRPIAVQYDSQTAGNIRDRFHFVRLQPLDL